MHHGSPAYLVIPVVLIRAGGEPKWLRERLNTQWVTEVHDEEWHEPDLGSKV